MDRDLRVFAAVAVLLLARVDAAAASHIFRGPRVSARIGAAEGL